MTCARRLALCAARVIAAALVMASAACQPAPPTATATAASAATATSPAATAAISAATASAPPTPALSTPAPTPAPQALTVCLGAEPRSLYRYAPPEATRAHIHAALYGGPLDGTGFAAGLLADLPSLANGDVVVSPVEVPAGAPVVDHLGRVVPLAEGVAWLTPNGRLNTFSAPAAVATLPQVTVTFRLRPGLRWSDGAPLTAHDSVFAFEVGRSASAFDPRADVAARTAAYAALDDLTVQWVGLPGYLNAQFAGLLWPPLPRHRYAGLTPEQIGDGNEANHAPLGWGPFRLAAWSSGDSLTLAPNPYYWRAAQGWPRLAGLTFRFLSDPAQVAGELASGGCDVAPSQAGFDDALHALAAGHAPLPPGVRVYAAPGSVLETLAFGLAPAPDYAPSPAASLLADERVRQAMAHCLDRAALAGGLGEPAAAWQPSAGLSPLPFDPARGRALLAEAGWTGDVGPLTLAGGPAGAPARQALLDAVAAQLAGNCGLLVTPLPLTRGELEADWPDGVIFGRRFDLALLAWRTGPGHCALYLSSQVPGPDNPGGANAGGYASAPFDEACRRSLAALDPAQTAAHDAEAQRLFAADLPAVPLFFRPRLSAARANVAGYALGATFEEELSNLDEWGIEEGQ